MIQATITGRLGRDAELKNTDGGGLCSFAVASSKKIRGEETTTWVSCTLWGKRGEALAPHLTKGTAVACSGELSTREGKNGKTYLELRVSEIDLLGGGQRQSGSARDQQRTFNDPVYDEQRSDRLDDIPF